MCIRDSVNGLHHLGGDNDGVNVGGQLLAGFDAVDKAVNLVLEHLPCLELGGETDEAIVLGGVHGEVAAILQADAALVAHKVDVALLLPDVLGPSAV